MARQNDPNWLPREQFVKLPKKERVFRYNTYFPSRGRVISGSSQPISPIRILLLILVVVLLTATLLRFFGGEDTNPPTFTGLIEYIVDAPTVNFNTGFKDYRITSYWGAFNFLRNFFNWFTSLISIGVWLAQSFINLLMYAIYFVKYLFLF